MFSQSQPPLNDLNHNAQQQAKSEATNSNGDGKINTLSLDQSTQKTTKAKEKSVRNRWKKVVNVVRVTKQKQKVRFIIDPYMSNDISECPIETGDCTVDESVIHYVDSLTKTKVAFCTKERFFWEILNSEVWLNRMRVTQGKLQTTILDSLKHLKEGGQVRGYQNTTYTTSSDQMKKFLRRGTLQKISKQLSKESGSDDICFRSTTEYFCKPDDDIFKLHPRLSSVTYIDSKGLPIIVTNSQIKSVCNNQPEDSKNVIEHTNSTPSLFQMTDIEPTEISQDKSKEDP
uniref:Uncharacterized protein n=2 Tax=Clytia hemisphaerica TaxID=252671 RepID=A0A7M6DPG1_9CNID